MIRARFRGHDFSTRPPTPDTPRIELGPYGYLPTDPRQLRDELGARGLKLSAGTVFTGFHKSEDERRRAWDQAVRVAGLASALGAEHIVVIPDLWRSDSTGENLEPRTLTDEQWRALAEGHDWLGKALYEEYGVRQQFHSHADSHVGTTREVNRFARRDGSAIHESLPRHGTFRVLRR